LSVDLNYTSLSNVSGPLNLSISLFTYFSFFLVGNILSEKSDRFKFRIVSSPYFLLMALVPLFTIDSKLPQCFYSVLLTLIFISVMGLEIRNRRAIGVIHFIGKRTYGTFCGHFIVLIGVENFDPNNQIRNHFSSFAELVMFFFVFAFGIALGAISYKFIERPIIRKSHNYISNRRLSNH
jgi:peptidoglycan/LPS O-acetylase OafA/YrhL